MKIAVTGPRGRLGSELVRLGCLPIEADITDFKPLQQAIAAIDPDVIIHTAAYTDVDACENNPTKAAKVNTSGTYLLRQVYHGKIVYISTDYIFDGRYGPYLTDALPNPLGVYGWSKLGGEVVLRNSDSLIVRTTVLFDQYSNNFVTAVTKKLQAGEIVSAPVDLIGSPTYVPQLAKVILENLDRTGVLNIAGNWWVSRCGLAGYIANLMGLEPEQYVKAGPITGQAVRPKRAGLTSEFRLNTFDGLREVIQWLGNNGNQATQSP